jgi:peptide/nickel transport system substrate-binding protein
VTSEFQPGVKAVYERFKDYIPRSEPSSWTSGGKHARVERIEWVAMPDAQTATNALINGEIDFFESPPFDMLDILRKSNGVKIEDVMQIGYNGVMYMNWLQPPFDNLKIRQALQAVISQKDVLDAQVGDPRFYSLCPAMFVCGSPLATDVGAPPLDKPDPARARQLLQEGGYKGEKVVILQATDLALLMPVPLVTAQALRSIGMNVELQSMDVQTLFTRRANQGPVGQGGWSIYNGIWQSVDVLNPITNAGVNARGRDGGWFGWAQDSEIVAMREKFIREPDDTKRKELAIAIQKRAYEVVTYIPTGKFNQPYAFRDTLKGLVTGPGPVFWNVSKA